MAHVSTQNSSTPLARKPSLFAAPWVERLAWTVASLTTLVVLWAISAALIDHRNFPSPAAVLSVLQGEIASGALQSNLIITLFRVAAAFFFSMLIGSIIGLLIGSFRIPDKFFDSWLVLFLNMPVLVLIALIYVWLGTVEAAAVLAVSMSKIPNVAVQMREGARSLSKDLAEMARMYRFGPWKTLRHVVIPQLMPFFAAAARSGLALVWKIVLVAEALGGHPTGVGHKIHAAYGLYDVPMILAYALAFIVVIQALEILVMQPLLARVNRWRR
jgi:NitT/TauT family transport system permease protein